jgi:phage terminase large subunit-like protein
MRDAWKQLHREAVAMRRSFGDAELAVERLARVDDNDEARATYAASVAEIAGDVDGILEFGESGPRLERIVAKGDKQFRMQLVAPDVETGRAVMVGRFPVLEHELLTWQPGNESPDRADAFVHACSLLGGKTGVTTLSRADERMPTNSTGLRRTGGSSRIGRSTGR